MSNLSLYSGNQKFRVYSGNQLYSIADISIPTDQYVSVDDGGQFILANGDILYINEKYGEIHNYDPGMPGIEINLESGHDISAYLNMLYSPGGVDRFFHQQSGYGVFYDLNGHEYDEGNFLRVYDLYPDYYDGSYQVYFANESYIENSKLIAVIYIEEDGSGDLYWHLMTGPQYYGSTVNINNIDTITVSGVFFRGVWSGPSVHFELESGNSSTAYYVRNGECVNHSSNGWFGINPEGDYDYYEVQDGDEIHIYSYTNGNDYNDIPGEDLYNESALFTYLEHSDIEYVELEINFSNGQWVEQ